MILFFYIYHRIKHLSFNHPQSHTNLNCKSWYIRATVARVPIHECPIFIERDSSNYSPLSMYSTSSTVLQISVGYNYKFYADFINLSYNLDNNFNMKEYNYVIINMKIVSFRLIW